MSALRHAGVRMTDRHQEAEPAAGSSLASPGAEIVAEAAKSGMPSAVGNLWTDLGPVGAYVISFNLLKQKFVPETGLISHETSLYWATGIFMTAVAAAIGWSLSQGRKIPPMLMITGVVVLVFGGLGIVLHDKQFIKIKPTIINLLFAVVIVGSLAIGRNIWKTAFEHVFQLPDKAWRIFALRWAGFYVFLAILNEVIWRMFPEDVWVNSKVFLLIPISMGFMLANLPFLMKHQLPTAGGADQV
jgi:intracellular septation protein